MRQTGVTLVELIISIVVISIGLAGVLLVMNRTAQSSADPMVQHQAVAIAEAYLEEILLKPFDEAAASGGVDVGGPEAGETNRTLFDDVNDYNGMANNGCLAASTAPCDQHGSQIAGLTGYAVTVNVDTAATLNGQAATLVRVTVAIPWGGSVVLSGYRTNYN